MSNIEALMAAEELPEFDEDKWDYFWGNTINVEALIDSGKDFWVWLKDDWALNPEGYLNFLLIRTRKQPKEQPEKTSLATVQVPEFFKAMLPEFDPDEYEYTWDNDDPNWEDCEFWGWRSGKWLSDGNASGYYFCRRPKHSHLSIEPEYVQEGDEKLSTSSDGTRKWVPYDPEKHKNIKNCSFRRRIKS